MKMGDVMVIAVTAALTAALALALSPAVRGANADESGAPAQPSLEVEGVVLSLTVDPDTSKPGGKPVLTLTGVNTQHHAVDFRAVIVMTATAPASPVARMLPMPTKAWSHEVTETLCPGETRTFELQTDVAVGTGKQVSFALQAGGKTITVAGHVTTPVTLVPGTLQAVVTQAGQ